MPADPDEVGLAEVVGETKGRKQRRHFALRIRYLAGTSGFPPGPL
jgi:hypothetical protein